MIKKLQNNFTTPEQSKRLLELGVPADSADCYYYEPLGKHNFVYVLQNGSTLKETERRQRIIVHPDTKLCACWSVGRLIEIMGLCYDFDLPSQGSILIYRTDIEKGSVTNVLISDIERFISKLDFSKLEE